MHITVTEEAQHFLESKKQEFIRIVARDTYECSTMIEFYLEAAQFKPEEDEQVVIGDITFIYNKKASDEIGSHIKIDYKSHQGLKLINQNQTLAYGLSLR